MLAIFTINNFKTLTLKHYFYIRIFLNNFFFNLLLNLYIEFRKFKLLEVLIKIELIIVVFYNNTQNRITSHFFFKVVRLDSFIDSPLFETIHTMQNQRNPLEQRRVGGRRLMLFVYQTSFCSESIRNFVRLAERALPFLWGVRPVLR